MKYSVNIDINLPRKRVIELLSDSANYKKWQPALLELEHQSGEAGSEGAKTKLVHKMGSKQVEMIETIEKQDLPDSQTITYVAKRVWNQVINRFEALDEGRTRWTMESEFRCDGFMKVIARLFPGMFKKESAKHLERFKKYAEGA